ncbi:MAG: molecular chaperone DnaK [Pirellulaceae bacterium]|nr:MAG: molecular chaperone DnaK [Pirellulaceae bacterium]
MARNSCPAVGIDLGTTYSVIARLDASGRPQTIPNAEGDILTPSVVQFTEGGVVVGKAALEAMPRDMANVAESPKRELGQRVYPKPLGGRRYPPEVLEAFVLAKLRADAAPHIGPVEHAVITVPAYFDEVRRKATIDAGYMAGIDVWDIVNEPTAAAIAFGFREGFLRPDGTAVETQHIVIYDLGGGTFDVTVMRIKGRQFEVLATDGDMRLGGRDWDQRLVDYVAEEFIRTYGVDPREDPNTFGLLLRECEAAKRRLSQQEETHIVFEYEGCPNRTHVTRRLLEDLTSDLLERTAFTAQQAVEAAGLTWQAIDRVLLIGGATRMPAVPRMLQKLCGRPPDQTVSPEEAVAQGAALHAGLLQARHAGRVPPFEVRNVNAHSLAVVGLEPKTRQRRTAVLIPRNTPLPASARRLFRTSKANQRSIRVEIVEGESPSPADCILVGKCTVPNLPPNLPAQTPIDVAFDYAENGTLSVRVQVAGTNVHLEHQLVRPNSLTPEQLDQWRQFIAESLR